MNEYINPETLSYAGIALILIIFFSGIRIVRPTHRGLIERLGKYVRFANPDSTGLSR
jgi:regulator of protease activity HflC (stomatin/prohibitin superfamily)